MTRNNRAPWGALLLLTTASLAAGCVVGGGEQTHNYRDLAGVSIHLGNGEVEVVSDRDRCCETELHLDLGGVGARTARGDVSVDRDGWLTVDARGLLGGGDIEVRLPPGVPVEVLVERGDALVQLDAPADVYGCVAAGSVTIEVPEGGYRLDLAGGAGAVSVDGVWHDPDAVHTIGACVGAGDVEVVGSW